MFRTLRFYDSAVAGLHRQTWVLPTLARLVYFGVLAVYFLNAGLTKVALGEHGLPVASAGAYVQILPRSFKAAGYDPTALGFLEHALVYAGILAEFALPLLIVLGLFTRLAALGMIGFVVLQSLTDVVGHGQAEALGAWFDRFADAAILDQRALWMLLLMILFVKGGGPFSVDRILLTQTR